MIIDRKKLLKNIFQKAKTWSNNLSNNVKIIVKEFHIS